MKNIKFLIVIFIIVLNNSVFSQQSYVGNWDLNWNNNGNGWINGWHIGSNDSYFPLRGKLWNSILRCAFFVNDNDGIWGIMQYDSINNNWQSLYTNVGCSPGKICYTTASNSYDDILYRSRKICSTKD